MLKLQAAFLRYATRRQLRRFDSSEVVPTVRTVLLGDYISNRIILDGIFEEPELDVLSRELFHLLPSNSTALDIGANIGNHTMYFARYFDRVIAFEPNPMAAAVLRVNVMGAGSNVIVVTKGLSDASGMRNFKFDNINLSASHVTDDLADANIEVTTLDALIEPLKLQNVSFLKIDVEGHEDKVIAGASEFLSASHPIVAMEGLYKDDPEKGARVTVLLRDLGYRHFYRLSGGGRTAIGRNLHKAIPKPFRRQRGLFSLERIDGLTGENHTLAIAAAAAI